MLQRLQQRWSSFINSGNPPPAPPLPPITRSLPYGNRPFPTKNTPTVRQIEEWDEIPLELPAQIFRTCQPQLNQIDQFRARGITHVVLLQPDKESEMWTQRKLSEVYREQGFCVIHLPIQDYSTPPMQKLSTTIKTIQKIAQDPQNKIVIHCKGGIGRTGLVAACLVSRVTNMKGSDAIKWIRQKLRNNHLVETPEQGQFVNKYFQQIKFLDAKIITAENHIAHLSDMRNKCGQGKAARAKKASLQQQIDAHQERLNDLRKV